MGAQRRHVDTSKFAVLDLAGGAKLFARLLRDWGRDDPHLIKHLHEMHGYRHAIRRLNGFAKGLEGRQTWPL